MMAAGLVTKLLKKFLDIHAEDVDLGQLTSAEPQLELHDVGLQNYIWILILAGSPWRFAKDKCRVGHLSAKFAWFFQGCTN